MQHITITYVWYLIRKEETFLFPWEHANHQSLESWQTRKMSTIVVWSKQLSREKQHFLPPRLPFTPIFLLNIKGIKYYGGWSKSVFCKTKLWDCIQDRQMKRQQYFSSCSLSTDSGSRCSSLLCYLRIATLHEPDPLFTDSCTLTKVSPG